ncbi:Homeobox-leucine zipper protein HDG11 [Forsythia ovata]|uniref:Homeobox-leucine zipper protein HDG11 n=1 Tax=Forsythia ovata TaxID=205694 RepID=A0ABD1UBJ6_9LAMI
MNSGYGGSGSGDEQTSNPRRGKKTCHRHSTQQIQKLEAFFKECPHPDENQRRQLSRELALDTKQIKFWFQNKRTQTKAQHERADNSTLRSDNERIHCENLAMKEALNNIICPDCDGPRLGEEERQRNLQKLKMENALLKEEHGRMLNIHSSFMGKLPISSQKQSLGIGSSLSVPGKQIFGQESGGPPLDPEQMSQSSHKLTSPYQLREIQEMEKSIIIETAAAAMDELMKLLQVKEPVWIKSPTDGRYLLHRDSYDKLFPKANHFKASSARIESSKDSGVVAMATTNLIEMLLDSNKWKDMFPTIISDARTIEVLDSGSLDGSVSLMYEKMHILSPLVPAREFFFIRYCRQLNSKMWIMVDVSYEFIKEFQDASSSPSWKLPSGCMIEDMSNGKSTVTWIEHVQVDDKLMTHRLYRDLICGCQAYGAKRWIASLQRMCERFAFSMGLTNRPRHELEEAEGRRNLMKLSHRMVKNFSEILSMSDNLAFPHISELNNSGVRVLLRQSNGLGQPNGLIVSAATSLWLPISPENLLNFFKDENKRAEWDVLSNGNPVSEIAHISTGTHPGNCISIIQPYAPKENKMLILQESSIDCLGAMMIYAPIELQSITSAMNGEDSTKIPILPSGYVISSDGRLDQKGIGASSSSNTSNSSGSLLTVAFQILVCCNTLSKQLHMESVATVHSLISSTIQKIKVALDCSELD